MISDYPEILNFNRLFLKLKRFIVTTLIIPIDTRGTNFLATCIILPSPKNSEGWNLY